MGSGRSTISPGVLEQRHAREGGREHAEADEERSGRREETGGDGDGSHGASERGAHSPCDPRANGHRLTVRRARSAFV